jgi:hypothetical protein
MKWYFLRWLRGWGDVADGLGIILSLGFWTPTVGLRVEGWFLDCPDPRDNLDGE